MPSTPSHFYYLNKYNLQDLQDLYILLEQNNEYLMMFECSNIQWVENFPT